MPPEDTNPNQAGTSGVDEPQFGFDGFSIDRLVFQPVERVTPAPDEVRPEAIHYEIHVSGKVFINEPKRASRVKLTLVVVVDPKWRPYRIEVDIVGRFSLLKGGSMEIFDQFTRFSGPPILFPFLREAVHRVTRDSKFGALLIKPINFREILDWELDTSHPTSPSEPLPLAAQSADVAKPSKP